jgi:Protein of unknown function (DUF3638)/Protein of unknown function (DUF3645)
MLILHWSFHDLARRDRLPRLNILSNLFSEAYDFFSEQLCGSIGRLKVFLLPFCRDVELDTNRLCAMTRLVEQCRQNRGVFIVAPEHRLSLELKEIELYRSGELDLGEKVHKLCHSFGWQDVLDESDELLHHRFQLIYACGSVAELPESTHRFQATQLLFRCLREDATARTWINKHPEFITLEEQVGLQSYRYCEAFPVLRLNMQLAQRQVLSDFYGILADSLILNPPVELDWLRDHPLQKDIRAVVVEPALPVDSLARLSKCHQDDILALRGLLAGGIFVHCLQKRHRVDYGIARGKKRVAVPFRGADVPARRAEFAQADCAIVLSCLAYYYSDGLDETQVHQAFEALLVLGKEARRKHYHAWFDLVKPRMQHDLASEDVNKLDCIEKIDLSNTRQFRKLVNYFQRNMKTINFWLNSCVFPDEMQYYPQRLTGTAWNLAESSGDGVIGFSGTNDNHRILPQQVKQFFQNSDSSKTDDAVTLVWKKLISTNGLMLSRILHHTSECRELPMTSPHSALLNIIKQNADAVHAIVDSGALFAGFDNLEIAKLLLEHLPVSFPGIVFFDDSEAIVGQWKVLERSGRLLPKDQSPIVESNAFAFFDEPRCRGSDLKLDKKAVALLTLGKKMCKDKFMQAAGRMRKLGHGQKLIIVAMKDVMDQVKNGIASLTVEAKHVLEWTMRNTFESNTYGLVPWATQGLFHCTSYGNPDLVVEDEKASVSELYGAPFDEVIASTAVRRRLELLQQRLKDDGIQLKASSMQMLTQVLEKADRYGTHSIKASHGSDEECERELELERELEEEEEIEIPRLRAVSELDWSLSSIFSVHSPSQLPKNTGVMSTSEFISKNLSPTSINRIRWTGRIYGSRNFFTTVVDKANQTPYPLNHYLRLVDVGIHFPNGEVLLVSEQEADFLMETYWEKMHGKIKPLPWPGPVLFHLSFLRSSLDGDVTGLSSNMLTLPRLESFRPEDKLIAELQLFAGETVYRTKSRRRALKLMVQGNDSLAAPTAEPEHIVGMRGFSHCLPYSDLEQVCKEVAREEEAKNLRMLSRNQSCQGEQCPKRALRKRHVKRLNKERGLDGNTAFSKENNR